MFLIDKGLAGSFTGPDKIIAALYIHKFGRPW
jgi:hypothetical protein